MKSLRSFGTETFLTQFVLPGGSALLVGPVEWLTRDGRQIWHHGIAPDRPVALPRGAPRTQLLTAIHELRVR